MEDKTKNSALLVMDVQRRNVDYFVKDEGFLGRLREAIDTARKAEMLVIYVMVQFRQGFPEVSPHNRLFSAIASRREPSSSEVELHPAIAPLPGDVVVKKVRISAFCGSDLEVILRSQGKSHLVLAGIATSGVVLSTLLDAADKDYSLTVIADCCADLEPFGDEEVQRVLLQKVFPRYAKVLTFEDWSKQIEGNN